ncbi:hypothetical protein GJAV_G00248880 [Gymnothorax javanicus]|nr:hypothetical protein GJAV_G00248880 [Gymnothorax javanicus]
MSSLQPTTADPPLPRLHRPFPFLDLEGVAVVAILLGLFQVLLAVPLYCLKTGLPMLFVLPLCLGVMIVTGGSFTVAYERSPRRELLKGCAYTNLAGLVGGANAQERCCLNFTRCFPSYF